MVRALLPGTFDPIHNGHLDIARRAARLFDEVIVAVSNDPNRACLFSLVERVDMAARAFAGDANIRVIASEDPCINLEADLPVDTLLSGLRLFSDFDRDFHQSLTCPHTTLGRDLLALIASEPYMYLSSSMVRELAALQADVSDLVPWHVALALQERFGALEKLAT